MEYYDSCERQVDKHICEGIAFKPKKNYELLSKVHKWKVISFERWKLANDTIVLNSAKRTYYINYSRDSDSIQTMVFYS